MIKIFYYSEANEDWHMMENSFSNIASAKHYIANHLIPGSYQLYSELKSYDFIEEVTKS